jgi:hypothetical protein
MTFSNLRSFLIASYNTNLGVKALATSKAQFFSFAVSSSYGTNKSEAIRSGFKREFLGAKIFSPKSNFSLMRIGSPRVEILTETALH